MKPFGDNLSNQEHLTLKEKVIKGTEGSLVCNCLLEIMGIGHAAPVLPHKISPRENQEPVVMWDLPTEREGCPGRAFTLKANFVQMNRANVCRFGLMGAIP